MVVWLTVRWGYVLSNFLRLVSKEDIFSQSSSKLSLFFQVMRESLVGLFILLIKYNMNGFDYQKQLPKYQFLNYIQQYLNQIISFESSKAMHRYLRQAKKLSPTQIYTSNLPFSTPSKTQISVSGDGLKSNRNFIPHVYGLELRNHIFPSYKKTVVLNEDQYKFYQKVSPNYVVGLVQKVLDLNRAPTTDQHEHSSETPIDKFYKVCTYCRIRYHENNVVELQGLHRSKIEQIKQITLQKLDTKIENEVIVETQQQNTVEQGEFAEPEPQNFLNNNAEPITIQELLKKSQPTRSKKKMTNQQTYYSLKVKKIDEPPIIVNSALEMKFKYLIDTYMKMHQTIHHTTLPIVFNIIDLSRILDHIANQCSQINSKRDEIQQCLEAVDVDERTDLVQKLLHKTIYVTTYLTDIEREAKNNLRNKKFYEYYSEILKIAKQVLDGKKSKELFIEKAVKNFMEQDPPKEIREVFNQELEKYEQMDQNSMQAGVVKAYIEELSRIPYNIQSQEIFDLEFATKVLDEDHYGMKEAKDAILEIIAVGKLKKSLKGKIFCFTGGPGLGKTSFAKSIAKALNRKFYNISLGGVSDSSALKGHRRTYIGAYSGKIIEALRNCGTNNPVILLDEIDKMGSSYQGDPRSQLLQILDPNQNSAFVDNFVDVPVDLSNVLFITSANYEQNISKPLLDRMEKITLTSYTRDEKIQIFKRHLLRRAIEKSGVLPEQFQLPDETINFLVDNYSLGEPGVRYLQKNALNILEKIAYKIVTGEEPLPIKVKKGDLVEYLGNSYYRDRDHSKIGKGVAIGLGGGNYGSRLTYIEAFKKSYVNRKENKRGLLFTGSLSDIFKQAMNISYTYARNFLQQKHQNRYLYENEVHIHAPEGASKKDGSTDSLTVVSALVSLALQKHVKTGVAVTGQITLFGQVLRTYGIKQKVIVAKREKINEIILPRDNMPDVDLLQNDVKEGITFHFVSSFDEVFSILFPGEQAQVAAKQ